MILANVGRVLWDFTEGVVSSMALAFDFMMTPITTPSISLFGVDLIESVEFIPLVPSSALILLLLGLGIFKAVNPL